MYKWKARLNLHRGQQVLSVHYWDTYTPVVTWHTVRFFYFVTDHRVAKSTTRLCHGLSTGPSQNALVHAFVTGVQTRRNIKEDTCTQVGAQHIWTKAGRSCMEQIHGPGHEGNWLQALRFRSLSLLPRLHHPRSQHPFDRRRRHGLACMLSLIHR